jgi:uncharacterized protein (TIGR02996 family)
VLYATVWERGVTCVLSFARAEVVDADPVERDLLDRIADDPRDAAVRMVYADWLEANGRAIDAEFLRVQLGLAEARDATDPAFAAAAARLAELAVQLPAAWRARVATARADRTRRRPPLQGVPARRSLCTNVIQARSVAIAGGCVAIDVRTAPDRRPHDLVDRSSMVVGKVALPIVRYGKR